MLVSPILLKMYPLDIQVKDVSPISCITPPPPPQSQEVVNQSWIVEVFHKQYSVNVKVESGQMLRDVSAEILDRTKLVKGSLLSCLFTASQR